MRALTTSAPIDGRTRLVGLIGWPVEHSMSPAMHNAAFAHLGLNWRYLPLPVPPGQVEAAVRGLAALGFTGANVTVPHKQEAHLALGRLFGLGSADDDATALGAVNTLAVEQREGGETRVDGYNTDVAGFLAALGDGGFDPHGASTVVVGAGGGARAVVFGLVKARAEKVTVLNRTPERGQALVDDLIAGSEIARPAIRSLPLTREALVDAVLEAQLLVNATPVGMWPRVDHSIWPDQVSVPPNLTVFDLVYNPLETKLLRQSRATGANAIDGLGMLVHQGALSFEMWTGTRAPLPVMRDACRRALQR